MNKKELRKELTLSILKEIEGILGKHNFKASRSIRKVAREASKTVAKKFVKALKRFPVSNSVSVIKVAKKSAEVSKPESVLQNRAAVPVAKKKVVPLKSKVKK